MEVGPSATVVFETSIFNGYIGHVVGTPEKPGVLELINCNLNNDVPLPQAITAGEFGYFRALRMRGSDGGKLLPDLIKWPKLEATVLDPQQSYDGRTPVVQNPEPK